MALFLLSACSPTVNWNYPRMPSTAFTQPQTTTVGALFQEAADQHPGLSGFSVIQLGERALMARVAMADLAEKTLERAVLHLGWRYHRQDLGRLPPEGCRPRR